MGYNTIWASAYTDSGLGQLIQTILYPLGFAKFILVLLVLSGGKHSAMFVAKHALTVS